MADMGVNAMGDEGDVMGFSGWISGHRTQALRLVEGRLGALVQRAVDADDVVQEASLVAVDAFGKIEPTGTRGVLSWFLRIAENRIRNIARRNSRKTVRRRGSTLPLAALALEEGGSLDALARSTHAGDPLESNERAARSLGSVEALRADHRAVLTLHDVLVVPWGTVGFLIARRTEQASRQLLRRARPQF